MSKFALAAACFSALLLPLHAQQGRGTILGKVTDPGGGLVGGATVTITNTQTNVASTTQTNSEGYYTSTPLIPGAYEVSVEMTGFKKSVQSGIALQVDQRAEVNIALSLGAVGESVQVTADAPWSIPRMQQ